MDPAISTYQYIYPNGQRFLTPDPIYSDHTMYGYANSSPYLLVDRDGCSAGWSLVIMMGLNEEIAKALFIDGRRFYGPPLHIGGVYWQSPQSIAADALSVDLPYVPIRPREIEFGPPTLDLTGQQPASPAAGSVDPGWGGRLSIAIGSSVEALRAAAMWAVGGGPSQYTYGPSSAASAAMKQSMVFAEGIRQFQAGNIILGQKKTIDFGLKEAVLSPVLTPSLMDDIVGGVDFTISSLSDGSYRVKLENSMDIASLVKIIPWPYAKLTGQDVDRFLPPVYRRKEGALINVPGSAVTMTFLINWRPSTRNGTLR